jgi:hypothetical protein
MYIINDKLPELKWHDYNLLYDCKKSYNLPNIKQKEVRIKYW